MNDSMETSNSISPTRPHVRPDTAMEGIHGTASSPNPDPETDNSWYEYPDISGVQANTSGIEVQHGDTTAEMNHQSQAKEEGEGEGDAKSETSSVMFDYDVDPEGFARRLDELAGTLEVGEEEARALRWGPEIGRHGHAPLLSITDFKALVNHHLDTTEWRYAQTRDGSGGNLGGQMSSHPIKVLGPARATALGNEHGHGL